MSYFNIFHLQLESHNCIPKNVSYYSCCCGGSSGCWHFHITFRCRRRCETTVVGIPGGCQGLGPSKLLSLLVLWAGGKRIFTSDSLRAAEPFGRWFFMKVIFGPLPGWYAALVKVISFCFFLGGGRILQEQWGLCFKLESWEGSFSWGSSVFGCFSSSRWSKHD